MMEREMVPYSKGSRDRMKVIGDCWDSAVLNILTACEQYKRNNGDFYFMEGNRGGFWKCIGCECIVHEKCFDVKDHWLLFKDNQFKCNWCF